MTDPADLDWTLVSAYLAGEASPGDRQRVEAWVASDPQRSQWFTQVRDVWQTPLIADAPALDVEASLAGIGRRTGVAELMAANRISLQTQTSQFSGRPMPSQQNFASVRKISRWQAWGMVAANIALIAVVWMGATFRATTQLADHRSVYTTGNGERATITLPDGSTVLLNVASQLEVPSDYGRGNRAIKLTGEAHFTVIPKSTAPFTVTTGQHTARVLGTTFVVREYPTDTTTTVVVRDGKVAVGPVVLTAGQETIVGRTGTPRVQVANTGRFAFVHGSLVIEDIPLSDAIAELNRWYDADIRLSNSALAVRRVVGTFETGSLTDLISIMELTFNVRVVREGRVLTLYPRG